MTPIARAIRTSCAAGLPGYRAMTTTPVPATRRRRTRVARPGVARRRRGQRISTGPARRWQVPVAAGRSDYPRSATPRVEARTASRGLRRADAAVRRSPGAGLTPTQPADSSITDSENRCLWPAPRSSAQARHRRSGPSAGFRPQPPADDPERSPDGSKMSYPARRSWCRRQPGWAVGAPLQCRDGDTYALLLTCSPLRVRRRRPCARALLGAWPWCRRSAGRLHRVALVSMPVRFE